MGQLGKFVMKVMGPLRKIKSQVVRDKNKIRQSMWEPE